MEKEIKPPIILWVEVERLGGLGGKSLYYYRLKGFRPLFYFNDTSDNSYIAVKSIDFQRSNFEKELQSQFFESAERGLYGICYKPILADKHDFLHVVNDELLDEFFRVEKKQQEYEEAGVKARNRYERSYSAEFTAYEPPIKAVKLEVKLGKIEKMTFTEYNDNLPINYEVNFLLKEADRIKAEKQERKKQIRSN